METHKPSKVLVVDDEKDILELLQYNLEKEGFEVRTCQNGKKAIDIAMQFNPDLIILDIMMPNQDGVETCRQLREIPDLQHIYIIFLTARTEEYSEIAAFDIGADDYITKPIKPRALMKRINALFRREYKKMKGEDLIKYEDLIVDRNSFTVNVGTKQVILPKKEFELLYFLVRNKGKVFSRDELLKNIWGSDVYVLARTVDVHIRKVREKIGGGYINTVKGVGYKLG